MNALTAIQLALVLAIGSLLWLMPALIRPTLQFGVRIPPQRVDAPVIARQLVTYRRWVLGATVLAVVVGVLVAAVSDQPVAASVGIPVLLVGGAVGYVRARRAIQAVKAREDWYRGLRQGVAVDTSLRTDPVRFPWSWAVPGLLILVGTAVYGVLRYPHLPDTLALHYNAAGVADRTAARSVATAFGPVFTQAGLTVLIVGLMWLSLRARADLDAAAPVASARRHREFAPRLARAMLVLVACLNLSMLVLAVQVWHGSAHINSALLLVPVVFGVAGLVAVAIRAGRAARTPPGGEEAEDTGTVQRDDDRYWRGGGLVYVNPDDPALMLPKRFGIGWTLNFGNPKLLLVLLGVVAVVLVVKVVA
ncbi:DUF1648 domain-containing protein [Solihabitans fulvus]|uniref:DUF1648 domain-containing protein n=1 Tax=Solihabitans fulvus TaxID=1892852 RepID=UPI001661F10D|nr:DUF5808 domain-containing protein [Solihabitans fulvus]